MSKITEIKQKQQDGSYKSFNISADTIVGLKNADWNQNDSTAADYIKNRTHYIDGYKKVELINASDISWNRNNYDNYDSYIPQNFNYIPNVGDIVYIDFNNSGIQEEHTVKSDSGPAGEVRYCGNLFLENESNTDTGEDFLIVLYDGREHI